MDLPKQPRSIMQSNIGQALRQTFNIKHSESKDDRVCLEGLELDGIAIVSQDCNLLQDVAHNLGYGDRVLFNFVQHGRWSCINIDKVKTLWRQRLAQLSMGEVIYNMVPGHWTDGAFYADARSPDVEIIIRPEGLESPTTSDHVLLAYRVYRILTDIKPYVPAVRYEHQTLECVRPIDIKTVSINHKGIYINRKFREKIKIVPYSLSNPPIISDYRLCLVYRGEVVLDVVCRLEK